MTACRSAAGTSAWRLAAMLVVGAATVLPALATAQPAQTLAVPQTELGLHAVLAALTVVVLVFSGLLLFVHWRERKGPRPRIVHRAAHDSPPR